MHIYKELHLPWELFDANYVFSLELVVFPESSIHLIEFLAFGKIAVYVLFNLDISVEWN